MNIYRRAALISAVRWAAATFIIYTLGIMAAVLVGWKIEPIRLFDPLVIGLIAGWVAIELNGEGLLAWYFSYQDHESESREGLIIFAVLAAIVVFGLMGLCAFGMVKIVPWLIGCVAATFLIDWVFSVRSVELGRRALNWLNND